MTSSQTQIVKAYEELHISLEDIAEEQDISVGEVKACLMMFSQTFRSAIKTEEGKHLDFDDDELESSNRVMTNLMQTTDDENLKFRIAKYIRDDKKGRKDRLSNIKTLNLNVSLFNEQLKKMRIATTSNARVVKALNEPPKPKPPAPAPSLIEQDAVEV